MIRYKYYQPVADEFGNNFLDAMLSPVTPAEYKHGYELVYEGEASAPEDVFYEHNRDDRPRRFEIRSMSVGDIVVMESGQVHLISPVGSIELVGDDIPETINTSFGSL